MRVAGNALKYYASVRVEVKKKETIKAGAAGALLNPSAPIAAAATVGAAGASDSAAAAAASDPDAPAGIAVEAKVVKNKCAPPYRTAQFDILFGGGISRAGCALDAAEAAGAVRRAGSHYYFDEEKLGNGRDNVLAALRQTPGR